MLKRVDRVILRVPQLESAVRYYRETLGMKLLRQDPRLASFQLAGGEGELVLHADDDLPAEATYYLVDDVRDLYNRRDALRLKFQSPPAQVSRGYRAQVRDPFGTVLLLLDRSTETSGGRTIEDTKSTETLFAGVAPKISVKREALVPIYEQINRTADDLPYTPHFETLYRSYTGALGEPKPTRQEVWRHILNLRKSGKLPKLGEAKSKPPKLDAEHEQKLRDLLGLDIGKRDRLPYTERFDRLVNEFNKTQPRKLSPHIVWRIVAKLAK